MDLLFRPGLCEIHRARKPQRPIRESESGGTLQALTIQALMKAGQGYFRAVWPFSPNTFAAMIPQEPLLCPVVGLKGEGSPYGLHHTRQPCCHTYTGLSRCELLLAFYSEYANIPFSSPRAWQFDLHLIAFDSGPT